MITETDTKAICEISKKYRAKRVLLFGPSLNSDKEKRGKTRIISARRATRQERKIYEDG